MSVRRDGTRAAHLTVIAKAPVAGRVKTRLCPPCTPRQAAAVAAAGMADTLDAIDAAVDAFDSRYRPRRVLLLDGAVPSWVPPTWSVHPQRGDGLDERLRNGFADLGPGVITGMETPHVAHLLVTAVDDVARGCDVLGPATDGGYWAIGLAAATIADVAQVFAGVPMSTPMTGMLQMQRLKEHGRRLVVLPTARDLDDIDDLRAVATLGGAGRLAALACRITGIRPLITPRLG